MCAVYVDLSYKRLPSVLDSWPDIREDIEPYWQLAAAWSNATRRRWENTKGIYDEYDKIWYIWHMNMIQVSWTQIQRQGSQLPGKYFNCNFGMFPDVFLIIFSRCFLSPFPDGTAKERWRCSTVSTPSKRSCPGCPLSKPRWRTSHYWDTKKQGHSKCPGLIPVVVSGHRKTVDP